MPTARVPFLDMRGGRGCARVYGFPISFYFCARSHALSRERRGGLRMPRTSRSSPAAYGGPEARGRRENTTSTTWLLSLHWAKPRMPKANFSSAVFWKECNSVGNRGGTQEPQWPSRREGALARTELAQGRGVRGSGPHCRKRPGLGSTVPRLAEAHSLESFVRGHASREASHSFETVL
jgi:hypothetical protein